MNTVTRQNGAALITALVCLIMVSLMGVIAVRTANTNAKVAANAKQIAQSMKLASSGVMSIFVDPSAIWDLSTKAGEINSLGNTQLGNADGSINSGIAASADCGSGQVRRVASWVMLP